MLKQLLVDELMEAAKIAASVYIIKNSDGKIKVTSNYPNSKSAISMAGNEVLLEINTSDEIDLDLSRAEEIIECYYDDDELEELEEQFFIILKD